MWTRTRCCQSLTVAAGELSNHSAVQNLKFVTLLREDFGSRISLALPSGFWPRPIATPVHDQSFCGSTCSAPLLLVHGGTVRTFRTRPKEIAMGCHLTMHRTTQQSNVECRMCVGRSSDIRQNPDTSQTSSNACFKIMAAQTALGNRPPCLESSRHMPTRCLPAAAAALGILGTVMVCARYVHNAISIDGCGSGKEETCPLGVMGSWLLVARVQAIEHSGILRSEMLWPLVSISIHLILQLTLRSMYTRSTTARSVWCALCVCIQYLLHIASYRSPQSAIVLMKWRWSPSDICKRRAPARGEPGGLLCG